MRGLESFKEGKATFVSCPANFENTSGQQEGKLNINQKDDSREDTEKEGEYGSQSSEVLKCPYPSFPSNADQSCRGCKRPIH